MGIFNGQPVDEAATNPAFLDANADDQAQGRIDFVNTVPASGPSVINIQREVNSLNSFSGRAAGSVFNALPAWTNNDVGSSGDNLKDRADSLTQKFNNILGHNHDGSAGNGVPISGSNLINVPLKGYVQQGLDLSGVTGGSTDVSTELSGKSPSAGPLSTGVVVTPPYNKLVLRQGSGANEDDPFVDGSGNIVYGRLTESSGVWTITYYVDISGTETAYSFLSSVDVRWYYQELYNPMINPPVYSEFANIPSDNPTQDVLDATTTQKGKVQLATTVAAISGTGTAGTPNAVVANADHTHEGVHSVKIDGDPTVGLGDITLTAGSGIFLQWVLGKIEITNTGGAVGYQETPAGVVDGVNTVFGPLTYLPSDNDSAAVFIDGILQPRSSYTLSSGVITFSVAPALGQDVYVYYVYNGTPSVPVVSGTFRVEYRTITSGEATAKALTLAYTPATPNYVMCDIIGGGPQEYAVDFSVTGATLSWSGLALDGILTTGDKLRLSYVT